MTGFTELLIASAEDATALASSSSAASIIPPNRKKSIPANFFDQLPKLLEIYAGGRLSTLASGPGTLTIDVRFGSTIVFNGGASRTLPTSLANATWWLEILLQARTLNFSGATPQCTLIGFGRMFIENQSPLLFPVSAPAAGTVFDPTASQPVDLFGTFSVNSASNSLTTHHFDLRTPSAV